MGTRAPEGGYPVGLGLEANTVALYLGARAHNSAGLVCGGGAAYPGAVSASFEVVDVGGGWGCAVCRGGAIEDGGESAGAEGEEGERDDLHLGWGFWKWWLGAAMLVELLDLEIVAVGWELRIG